jgi:hypothetical protein
MKTLLVAVLILNALTEAMAAAMLIGGPNGVQAAGAGEMWSMHYGFAAVAIASIGLWLWPYRRQMAPVSVALGILLTFHSGLFVSLALAGDQAAGMVVHALLAVLCAVLFFRRASLCDDAGAMEKQL